MSTASSSTIGERAARAAVLAVAIAMLATGCVTGAGANTGESGDASEAASPSASADIPLPDRQAGIVTNDDLVVSDDAAARWASDTRAEPIQIVSSSDGVAQRALWSPPQARGGPLLVHLHSWSSGFDQQVGVPIAQWADSAGWGFIQPDFRGVNDNPSATGSTLATQDVIDAVDFAVAEGGVDPERVYLTGFSGGGMMSLLTAGRFADRIAGVAAWVPVYDLVTWYAYNRDFQPERTYATQIEDSCSGDPTVDVAARDDCAARSPSSVMADLRAAGIPVYLAGGAGDDVVPVGDVLRAFNTLADEGDRIPDAVIDTVTVGELPTALAGDVRGDTRFTPADPPVLFSRSSASVTAVVFDGGHAFVYYPGLDWLARVDASVR